MRGWEGRCVGVRLEERRRVVRADVDALVRVHAWYAGMGCGSEWVVNIQVHACYVLEGLYHVSVSPTAVDRVGDGSRRCVCGGRVGSV